MSTPPELPPWIQKIAEKEGRHILFASYGTLKRNARCALPPERGHFVTTSFIPKAQLYVNRHMTYWPVIGPGKNLVECDLYLMNEADFEWLKQGEEANSYTTKIVPLADDSISAYTFWYSMEQINSGNRWIAVSRYPSTPEELAHDWEDRSKQYSP